MKKLQQFFVVIVLTLAFALSASAGDILGPGALSPPPPPQTIVTGDRETPGATAKGDILIPAVTELDPVTQAALSILQSILSLF